MKGLSATVNQSEVRVGFNFPVSINGFECSNVVFHTRLKNSFCSRRFDILKSVGELQLRTTSRNAQRTYSMNSCLWRNFLRSGCYLQFLSFDESFMSIYSKVRSKGSVFYATSHNYKWNLYMSIKLHFKE